MQQNGILFRGYSNLVLCIDFKSLFRYQNLKGICWIKFQDSPSCYQNWQLSAKLHIVTSQKTVIFRVEITRIQILTFHSDVRVHCVTQQFSCPLSVVYQKMLFSIQNAVMSSAVLLLSNCLMHKSVLQWSNTVDW